MFKYKYRKNNSDTLVEKEELKNVWVDADNLTNDEAEELGERLGVDLGILNDVKDIFESPRYELDEEDQTIYFLGRYVSEKRYENLYTLPFLIALGKDYVLTVFHGDVPYFIQGFRNEHNHGYNTYDRLKFFISLMKNINQRYQQEFRKINKEVFQNKAHIQEITDKEIERFVELETIVNEYLNVLIPTERELNMMLKNIEGKIDDEEYDLFEDLILAEKQLIESGKNILKLIQNIRNAFEIIATNRLNQTVTRLTIVTVVLAIPTMVAGIFGMNLKNGLEESNYAFVLVTIISFILSYLFYLFLLKKK